MDWTPPPDPPAIIWQAKKKGGSSSRSRSRRSRAAYAVGAIILLSDGTRCEVTGYDSTGQLWCRPLPE